MKREWLLTSLLLTSAWTTSAQSQLRDWTIADSVSMSYLTDDHVAMFERRFVGAPSYIVPSPSGRYFFFGTNRGELSRDVSVYELSVYATDQILGALANGNRSVSPSASVSFDSASSRFSGIRNPRWSEDGIEVLFAGMQQDVLQLFSLNAESGALTKLTSADDHVLNFQVRAGAVVAHTSRSTESREPQYPMVTAERGSDGYAVRGVREPGRIFSNEIVVSRNRGEERRFNDIGYDAWIAPDGRMAVVQQKIGTSPTTQAPIWQYALLDFDKGTIRSLLNAPYGRASVVSLNDPRVRQLPRLPQYAAHWVDGGRHVLLVNTMLPGAPPSLSEPGYVVDVDTRTGRWTVISRMVEEAGPAGKYPRFVTAVHLLKKSGQLILVWDGRDEGTKAVAYPLSEPSEHARPVGMDQLADLLKTERSASAGDRFPPGFRVFVRQGINDPPVVVAASGQKEIELTTINPRLDQIWRARAEPIRWPDPFGSTWGGALLLPRKGIEKGPYPLVIQIERHLTEESWNFFLPDGGSPKGYAAQALVANGIAVLRMAGVTAQEEARDKEGEKVVARLDAAVDALAARGIVDPDRVGVVGFSRAGFHVFYALTHPGKVRFAAGICLDSYTGSFTTYLAEGAAPGSMLTIGSYAATTGGSFWEKKEAWLATETTFNVDKVRTPTLFTMHGTEFDMSPWLSLDVLASYRLNRRPLEYLYFPYGQHQMYRPRERLEEMTAVVDWMRFWLQGAVPEDTERAARWSILREQQEAVLKQDASGVDRR